MARGIGVMGEGDVVIGDDTAIIRVLGGVLGICKGTIGAQIGIDGNDIMCGGCGCDGSVVVVVVVVVDKGVMWCIVPVLVIISIIIIKHDPAIFGRALLVKRLRAVKVILVLGVVLGLDPVDLGIKLTDLD